MGDRHDIFQSFSDIVTRSRSLRLTWLVAKHTTSVFESVRLQGRAGDTVLGGKARAMARVARVVIADVAHHVTQRGNGRQFILASEGERGVYLELLRQAVRVHELSVLGYCLMSNHVHVVVMPQRADDLAEAFHQVHGRYAACWNLSHASSGHAWQGRFYSCPMDEGHQWTALRYVKRNPVRAGMVEEAAAWAWSSAAADCGAAEPDVCLNLDPWRRQWTGESWGRFLEEGESASELRAIRRSTHTGRPLGPAEFTRELEARTLRRLTPSLRGRPRKAPADAIPLAVALKT